MQKIKKKAGRPGKNMTKAEVILRQQCGHLATLADKLGKAKEVLEGEVSEVLETLWNGQIRQQKRIDRIIQHLGIEEEDDGNEQEDAGSSTCAGPGGVQESADSEGSSGLCTEVCTDAPGGEPQEVQSTEGSAKEEERNPG